MLFLVLLGGLHLIGTTDLWQGVYLLSMFPALNVLIGSHLSHVSETDESHQ